MLKNCKKCNTEFEITDSDLKFYDRISPVFNGKKYDVPPPTFCPSCRDQRRQSLRNEKNLYTRTCDFSGKHIISFYSPDKPFKVFHKDIWWSDTWDPMDYGQEFEFTKTFTEQYRKLSVAVPRFNLFVVNCENCEYLNLEYGSRNCYMIFTGGWNENCYYGHYMLSSKDCMDCKNINKCERCYELIECDNCYACKFSQHLTNCSDCTLCYDCHSCKNCFGCYNLIQKEYYFYNKQLSKDEYFQKLGEIWNGNYSNIQDLKRNFLSEVSQHAIHKNLHNLKSENCSGNYIANSKDCSQCFEMEECRDCKYVNVGDHLNDSMDCYISGYQAELCYEGMSQCLNVIHNLFCNFCWEGSSDLLYCDTCLSCQNCFGCIGLRHKKYCIFNKQYSKEEYEEIVPKIIKHMTETGEWGEFFDPSLSPFGYNESLASEYFPLEKDEALKQNFNWCDYNQPKPVSTKTVKANTLPENIQSVSDEILNHAIECEVTGKLFKLIAPELEFYRKENLPLPHHHPDQRHLDRMSLRNPRHLFSRTCAKCQKEVQTTYSPSRPETVYCEKCYLETVY